ncbi:MAG: beta-propeller fold lactonase family protein [Nitrospirae bacterium]|nr:beta-propeller fold lactonase family protein [Nitrospirota bacterium]
MRRLPVAVRVIINVILLQVLSLEPVHASGATVFTADEKGGTVSAIDPGTGSLLAQIKGLTAPHNIHIGPDGLLYVTDGPNNIAVRIDPVHYAILDRWPTGKNPAHIFITPDRKYILVTNTDSDDVTVTDLKTLKPVATIPTGHHPHGISVRPDGRYAFVANMMSSDLTVIDLERMAPQATVKLRGEIGVQAWVTPDGRWVYVSSLNPKGTGIVTKIDASTFSVVTEISVGSKPAQLGVTPDGHYLVVCNQGSNSISVIDTRTDKVIKEIPGQGEWTHGVSFSNDGRWAYFTNTNSHSVAVMDLSRLEVVKTLSVGRGPNGIAASYPYPRK